MTVAVLASGVLALPYRADAQVLTTLPTATTPYTGKEVCYVVQGGVSKQFFCLPAGGTAPPTVQDVVCGTGLSGGTITTTGTCSLLTQEQQVTVMFPSVVPVVVAAYPILAAYRAANVGDTLVVDSIDAITGGSASPGYTANVVNGASTLTCGGGTTITVGTAEAQSTCSAGNTIVAGNALTMNVLTVTGTPDNSAFQLNYHWVP